MARSARRAPENRAIHQHRSADAGAERQQDHVAFSAGSAPQHFRNQRRARVIVGIDRQVSRVDYVGQKPSFQEVQVSGQAVYPRGCRIDHTLASNADAAHRRIGLLQDRVYKVTQGGRCARRRLVKALEQLSAKGYRRSFNGGGTDVNANRNRLFGGSVWPVRAHSRCALYALYDILVSHRCLANVFTVQGNLCKEREENFLDNPAATSNASGASLTFFERALDVLLELKRTQAGLIQKAAELCADRIARGGLVFLFGNGHSRMMCEEMTPRQGCFVGFVALVELALSNHAAIIGANGLRPPLYLENYEGYAEQILRGFHFGPNDAFIVISTSGIRPVVVEAAMGAQRRALPVIAIVSKAHCEQAKAAHSSGKKLIDCADLIIDNLCPPGDCVVELEGLEWRTGPVSTITGAMIINMMRCATAEALLARGIKPVVLPSHQFVGNTSAETQLESFYEAYRKSLKHLFE